MKATTWRVAAVFVVVGAMCVLAAALPDSRGLAVMVLAFAALYAAAEAAYQGSRRSAERDRADDAEAAVEELCCILDAREAEDRAEPGPLDLN